MALELLSLLYAFENSTKVVKYRSILILFRIANGLLLVLFYFPRFRVSFRIYNLVFRFLFVFDKMHFAETQIAWLDQRPDILLHQIHPCFFKVCRINRVMVIVLGIVNDGSCISFVQREKFPNQNAIVID